MRWKGLRRSRNVDDRCDGVGFGGSSGGGFPGPVSRGGMGRGTVGGGLGIIVILVLGLLFGFDPNVLLQGPQQESYQPPPVSQRGAPSQAPDELADFVSAVLGSAEDTWHAIFRDELGQPYREPRLVLFSGRVHSACGMAASAMGPFYCPTDQQVYIDLSFYRALRERFRAPGDFAQAYVVAHEVGHHVQNLLGIAERVHAMRGRVSPVEFNQIMVRTELQADCFAGLWAHRADRARGIIETGDVEEALNAASAIGDDNIQRQTQGHVVPDAFTHGSAAQRVRWFRRGLETGRLDACDTFGAEQL
ncbi:MAG: flagellar biosynthesis protein FlgM [Alphaproteobacteria bacterium]|nr:flagellar biosynthesis protein FlgM [Alphaproteobacteria bacterium]